MRNKYSFLKDIHIQNDENVFFLFIYLIFIYFYKIKKIYETKKKKAKQVKDLRRKRRKAIEQTGTTVLVFFYICTRQVYPFKFFFLKRTVQKEKNKSLTKNP